MKPICTMVVPVPGTSTLSQTSSHGVLEEVQSHRAESLRNLTPARTPETSPVLDVQRKAWWSLWFGLGQLTAKAGVADTTIPTAAILRPSIAAAMAASRLGKDPRILLLLVGG